LVNVLEYTKVTFDPVTADTFAFTKQFVVDGLKTTFWFRPRRVGWDTARVTPVSPFELDVRVVVSP